MKKLFLFVSLFFSLACTAQSDTTTIEVTLKARHHAWVVSLMPDRGAIEKTKYSNQVANALVVPVDTAQLITVTVSYGLIKELYLGIGSQQERLAADYNNEIKEVLVPQLANYPELIQAIINISLQNASETNILVNSGFDYLKAIKTN